MYDNLPLHYSETSNHIELIKWYHSQSSNGHCCLGLLPHTEKASCPRQRAIDDSLWQEPFLKSNYTTVCRVPSSQFPYFSLVCRRACVCMCTVSVCVCACACTSVCLMCVHILVCLCALKVSAQWTKWMAVQSGCVLFDVCKSVCMC